MHRVFRRSARGVASTHPDSGRSAPPRQWPRAHTFRWSTTGVGYCNIGPGAHRSPRPYCCSTACTGWDAPGYSRCRSTPTHGDRGRPFSGSDGSPGREAPRIGGFSRIGGIEVSFRLLTDGGGAGEGGNRRIADGHHSREIGGVIPGASVGVFVEAALDVSVFSQLEAAGSVPGGPGEIPRDVDMVGRGVEVLRSRYRQGR